MLSIRVGEVWKDRMTGKEAKVERVEDAWDAPDPGSTTVNVRYLESGEVYGIYRDNFERNWTKVSGASGGGGGGFRDLEDDL